MLLVKSMSCWAAWEIINISVLVYDNADHTDDDTDSLDVSGDPAHSHRMPHVEMVPPKETEEDRKEEPEPGQCFSHSNAVIIDLFFILNKDYL